MVMPAVVGWVAGLISVIAFGTQGIFVKSRRIRDAGFHPAIAVILFSFAELVFGAVALGILSAMYPGEAMVTWQGAAGALAYAPSNTLLLYACRRIGVGMGIGLVASANAVTGYVVGEVIPDLRAGPFAPLSLLGIALFVTGAAVMVYAKLTMNSPGEALGGAKGGKEAAGEPGKAGDLEEGGTGRPEVLSDESNRDEGRVLSFCSEDSECSSIPSLQRDPSVPTAGSSSASPSPSPSSSSSTSPLPSTKGVASDGSGSSAVQWIVLAIVGGIVMGLQSIPLGYVSGLESELITSACFLIIQFPLTVIFNLPMLYFSLRASPGGTRRPLVHLLEQRPEKQSEKKHLISLCLDPIIGGIVFAIGFFGQVFAIAGLGPSIGTPLTQLNLIVAALWGILLYREMTSVRALTLFSLAVTLMAGGMVVLGIV